MLRSPVYAQRMYDLLDYLRWHTSVPTKLNEMAILIVGRQWRSQVEWFAHAPLAKKAGLADSIIADLKANKRPAGMSPDEEVVYDFVTDLTTKHAVSDDLFDRAKKLLGEQQVVDLTAVAGTYVGVAMILAMAEEGVPVDEEPPFKAANLEGQPINKMDRRTTMRSLDRREFRCAPSFAAPASPPVSSRRLRRPGSIATVLAISNASRLTTAGGYRHDERERYARKRAEAER
jgi:alkylhydroperoxidase family enzyme